MGRNTQLSIEDENGLQKAIYKVPYGSKLFSKTTIKLKILRYANGTYQLQ